MPINGTPIETFSTPPPRNFADVQENSCRRIWFLKLIFSTFSCIWQRKKT